MFERIPFSKMLLHAAKYPHAAVNGILVGPKQANNENAEKQITDCIPLFHLNLTLLPMLEIAMNQIEVFCAQENLTICGYYHMHAHITATEIDTFIQKFMERLNENYPGASLYMVKNHKLNTKEIPYAVYEFQNGKLTASKTTELQDGSLESSMEFIRQARHRQLVDFDNYLDDCTLDWRNPNITD